jgi:CheY-like chemotaxis protein
LLPGDDSVWRDLPRDEPYIWEELFRHLEGAGRSEEMLVTATDLGYLALKTFLVDAAAARRDVLAAAHYFPDSQVLQWLQTRLEHFQPRRLDEIVFRLGRLAPSAPPGLKVADLDAIRPAPSREPPSILSDPEIAKRAERIASDARGAQVLLVNDEPETMRPVVEFLVSLDIRVTVATSTELALEKLHEAAFDVVISDMRRDDDDQAGLQLLRSMLAAGIDTPVVFTVGRVDPERGVPDGAVGITARFDELVTLVFDVLEGAGG